MTSFRRRQGSKKSYPISPKQGTVFGPPRDKAVAEEVHSRSIGDARSSARELQRDFDGAATRAKKERVWRATLEEANRLQVGSHNMRNSPEARFRLGREERVFRERAERMHAELYG